jgi:hypothetical protein
MRGQLDERICPGHVRYPEKKWMVNLRERAAGSSRPDEDVHALSVIR